MLRPSFTVTSLKKEAYWKHWPTKLSVPLVTSKATSVVPNPIQVAIFRESTIFTSSHNYYNLYKSIETILSATREILNILQLHFRVRITIKNRPKATSFRSKKFNGEFKPSTIIITTIIMLIIKPSLGNFVYYEEKIGKHWFSFIQVRPITHSNIVASLTYKNIWSGELVLIRTFIVDFGLARILGGRFSPPSSPPPCAKTG